MNLERSPFTVLMAVGDDRIPVVEWTAAGCSDEAGEKAVDDYCTRNDYTKDQVYVLLIFRGHHLAETFNGRS